MTTRTTRWTFAASVGASTLAAVVAAGPRGGRASLPPARAGTASGSGSGIPFLSVTPNPLLVGPVLIGGSGSGDITIANPGSGAITLAGTTSPGTDWTLGWDVDCPAGACTLDGSLGHGSTLLHVTFAPSNPPGDKSVTIDLANSFNTTQPIMLQGSGVSAPMPAIDVTPASLDFTAQASQSSTPQPITLKNVGNQDLVGVAINGSGVGAPLYTISPTTLDLVQGQMKDVSVACTPASAGAQPGAMLVITGGGSGTTIVTPMTIPLTCTGTTPSALGIAPQTITFKEVRVGGSLPPATVTLTTTAGSLANATATGSAELVISPPSPSTITVATPSTFTVGLDTTTEHVGLSDAIAVSAGGLAGAVTVKGSITTPAIAHDAAIDLGTFCIGKQSPSANAAFTATGTATIAMQKPALAAAASPFTLTYLTPAEAAYTGGYALAAGATATVAIHTTDQAAPIDVADRLVWASDMPGIDAVVETSLAAHFVDAGGAIAPKTITFPTVAVRELSDLHTITLQNCDALPLELHPPMIAVDGAFHDVSPMPLPAMLAPLATATIAVQFAPTTAGAHQATLTVATSAGPLTAELHGNATAGADGNGEKVGFYACGCRSADAATGGPIVVAIAGVVFRRRRNRA